jgi:hypothetical protein
VQLRRRRLSLALPGLETGPAAVRAWPALRAAARCAPPGSRAAAPRSAARLRTVRFLMFLCDTNDVHLSCQLPESSHAVMRRTGCAGITMPY